MPLAMPAAGAAEMDKLGWEPWSGGLADRQAASSSQARRMLTPAALHAEVLFLQAPSPAAIPHALFMQVHGNMQWAWL